MNNPAVITGVKLITPAGESSETVYASINAGISFIELSDELFDSSGKSIKSARINIDKEGKKQNLETFFFNEFNLFIQEKLSSRKKTEKVSLILNSGIDISDSVFVKKIEPFFEKIEIIRTKSSNSSTIEAFEKADRILAEEPDGLCLIVSIDSLIQETSLEKLEKEKRLATEGNGGYQKLVPSEGAAFFIIEKNKKAKKLNLDTCCSIEKTATSTEPFPLLSDEPSKGEGLTKAFYQIFKEKPDLIMEISDVFSDLNGEYYRSKEWGFIENRFFADNRDFKLWHPADCIGDTGGAFSGILTGIGCEHIMKKEDTKKILVFSSDEDGDRGVVILSKI